MAARRKPQTRRSPVAATTKPAPAEAKVASVQTQAAETAAKALLADARSQADATLIKARDEASIVVRAAAEQNATLTKEAQQAGEELRRKAGIEAERLITSAQAQVRQLRADADATAADMQASAELAAQRTEKAAQGRADLLHQQAVADAEKLAADARARADRIGALAIDEAERITQAAKAESEVLLAEARTIAEQSRSIAEKAEADAARIVGEAKGLRTRSLAAADSEAEAIRETARKEVEKQDQRGDMFDTWSARLVIAGTVGLTASGEYALARMVGFDRPVAWLLPFVIDVYVIQAFRRHRDIIQAIALTVAANVIFHLADKGLFGVEKIARDGHEPKWWLIAMVASIASIILWRMHTITAPAKAAQNSREEGQNPAPQTAGTQRQEAPAAPTERPTEVPPTRLAKTATSAANSARQEAPSGGDKSTAKTPAKKATTGGKNTPAKSRQKTVLKKAPRRSMTEWVDLTEPVFHAEFKRLKRNPTASEFADAIGVAGHGQPSDSTAKSIRTEILDRTELASLDTE